MEAGDEQRMNLSADGTRGKQKQQRPYSNQFLSSSTHMDLGTPGDIP